MTIYLQHEFVVQDCCWDECGITFAVPRAFDQKCQRDHNRWFYCPRGHKQHYTGKTTEQKLRDAEAREVALKDQVSAAVRDAETVRIALLRDRQRFANGVCPCCNRSFQNVRRHMETKHPDYDVAKIGTVRSVRFTCSCGRSFDTLRGLRTHQGHQRGPGWDKPTASRWSAHLTKVAQ